MKTISLCVIACVSFAVACEPAQPAASPTPPSVAASGAPSAAPPPPAAQPVAVAEPAPAQAPPAALPIGPLTANIEAKSGSKASGQVTLTESKPGVTVKITVAGLKAGAHGLHFHEVGDCSAPDAASAKAHYNPEHHDHGLPTAQARHLGDLGNITVDKDGKGTLEIALLDASLDPKAPNTLRGKAVILHEKSDDGSQPAGNSGARIGCAVIP